MFKDLLPGALKPSETVQKFRKFKSIDESLAAQDAVRVLAVNGFNAREIYNIFSVEFDVTLDQIHTKVNYARLMQKQGVDVVHRTKPGTDASDPDQ